MRFINTIEQFQGTTVSRIPGAASVYRLVRDLLIWKHQLTAGEQWIEYNGDEIYADTSDFVAQSLSIRGQYEPETTKLIERQLNEGDFAVDIGGHIGHHASTMRQRVGEGGAVWVFEPNPKNAGYIEKTLIRNGWKNIELFPVALSDTDSADQLIITDTKNTGSAGLSSFCLEGDEEEIVNRRYTVDTRSLSRLLNRRSKERVDLLKIDVEGAEADIISDLKADLHRVKTIIMEFHTDILSDTEIQDIFEILNQQGRITDIDGDIVDLERLLQEKIQIVWQAN